MEVSEGTTVLGYNGGGRSAVPAVPLVPLCRRQRGECLFFKQTHRVISPCRATPAPAAVYRSEVAREKSPIGKTNPRRVSNRSNRNRDGAALRLPRREAEQPSGTQVRHPGGEQS